MTISARDPRGDYYAPPEAALESKRSIKGPVLASRTKRVGGILIDSIAWQLTMVPLYATVPLTELSAKSAGLFAAYTDFGVAGWTSGAITVALSLLNWSLIAKRGQSVGKLLVRSRIEQIDGTPAGFVRGVVLRQWILAIPSYVLAIFFPTLWTTLGIAIVSTLGTVDGLMGLVRKDRRCGHDFIARTRVVDTSAAA